MPDGSRRGAASSLLGIERELSRIGPGTVAVVTGGTGFIGANLVRALLGRGATVHLLVRAGSQWQRLSSIRPHLHAHEVSLVDALQMRAVLAAIKPDICFHLASYGSSSWQNDGRQIAELTCMSIVNLLEAAIASGCRMVVNAGSSSEYGRTMTAPAEEHALNPDNCYGAAKAFATHWCRVTAQGSELHAPTLRLYSVYGPFESPRRFIAALILAGRRGTYPPLVAPDVARDFVHVDDVVAAFLTIAERMDLPRDGIYNVGTGVQTTIRDAAVLAAEYYGIAESPEWSSMPNRQWDTHIWVANPQRLRELTGWQPRTFRTGFCHTANWDGWHEVHP